MTFVDAASEGFRKYVVWQGRSVRSEFWFFYLLCFACSIGASIVDAAIGMTPGDFGLFYALTILAFFLPSLSVTVRRLHDTDRSGWWYWIALIPIVGAILLIVWLAQRGTVGPNRFGPDPFEEGFHKPAERYASSSSDLDRLERLAELRRQGILSDAEYEAQKAALLRL